jgi:hypothetical protein
MLWDSAEGHLTQRRVNQIGQVELMKDLLQDGVASNRNTDLFLINPGSERYVASNPASPATRRRATPTTSPTWCFTMSLASAGMNFRIHKGNSQSVADRFRFSSAYGDLNQIVSVFFLHKWKAGEKQTGRALPLSRQYAPFSGTPKPPHPVKQRQNFVECRWLDFFKKAMPGLTGLAAAATAIFSHGSACISLEITSKIYLCCLLSNRLALFPGFAEIWRIGHFSPQFSAIRRRGTHQTKTAPTS